MLQKSLFRCSLALEACYSYNELVSLALLSYSYNELVSLALLSYSYNELVSLALLSYSYNDNQGSQCFSSRWATFKPCSTSVIKELAAIISSLL